MSSPRRVTVGGAAPYDVVIGTALADELPAMVGDSARQVAVIHPRALRATGDENIVGTHLEALAGQNVGDGAAQ